MGMFNTVAMAAAGLLSFALSALLGKWLIPQLHKLHFGQTIREEGPAWHEKKQGTPTMGGVLFILSTTVCFLGALGALKLAKTGHVFLNPYCTVRMLAGMGLALGCGLIGFADDFIKVVKKRNLGLTAMQKLLLQLFVAGAYAVLLYFYGGGDFRIPFVGEVHWGIWYIPFCMFVIVAMTNATNLSDGVDGLCGMSSFVAALFLLLLAGLSGLYGESMMASAMAGGLAGFLVWNIHPAKVFMGDTGSLFIGGALAGLAFGIEQPFMLVPVGILFIAENLSVILQVGYFKLTHGKRLFKMSPLHHHFELCGWSENKIVAVFSAVTFAGGLIAVLIMLWAPC